MQDRLTDDCKEYFKQMLRVLKEGGVWTSPLSGLVYTIHHHSLKEAHLRRSFPNANLSSSVELYFKHCWLQMP